MTENWHWVFHTKDAGTAKWPEKDVKEVNTGPMGRFIEVYLHDGTRRYFPLDNLYSWSLSNLPVETPHVHRRRGTGFGAF